MSELANAQASAIERRLEHSLSATYILAQEVRQHQGTIEQFETYAADVISAVGGISNLQLAPNGIISHIHPLQGNEKAIGHNILEDDQRLKEARLAIAEHRLTLAGPFELIQGGVGVIGRNPIYLTYDEGEGETFWGFASALIFLDDLIESTELNTLEKRGYSYELRRRMPESNAEETFARSKSPLSNNFHTVTLNVPNGSWELLMSQGQQSPAWITSILYLLSSLVALLCAGMTHYLLRQPETLRKIVNEKTVELERLAYHDHLTGLVNRRYLSEHLERIINEYTRYKKSAALLYIDLDDFKKVNDSQGHSAGDVLLKQIARRLEKIVRSSDIVARLGGDEFAILLLHTESIRDISNIAKKLIAAIEQPVILDNRSFVVSASLGITVIPADGEDADALLRNTDMAMYSAKKSGKSNFCFYDGSLQTAAIEKLQLEEDLSMAIAEQQFVLHFQPIISLSNSQQNGYEALIRWQHPTQGLLRPDSFIGAAEETRKIIDIGYWVIREVCRQIKERESSAKLQQRFSINLSATQFKDPLLLETICDIVGHSGIDAHCLEFEVTESCIVENVACAVSTLKQFQEMGILVSIDDFGTGYSSFALLKLLPVDKIKIDRSFIKDLETDVSDQNIVQGLISMAHKLQLEVVAEGIETETQKQLLESYACDLGQGYLFSEPLPMDQLDQSSG